MKQKVKNQKSDLVSGLEWQKNYMNELADLVISIIDGVEDSVPDFIEKNVEKLYRSIKIKKDTEDDQTIKPDFAHSQRLKLADGADSKAKKNDGFENCAFEKFLKRVLKPSVECEEGY